MSSATTDCARAQVCVSVRFEPITPLRRYTADGVVEHVRAGQMVILEEEKSAESGTVVGTAEPLEDPQSVISGKVLRVATEDDRLTIVKNALSAKQALAQAQIQVSRRGLPMKLHHARYSFDRTRLTFQFVAEDRVDFRELLKDLAAMFKARIELRQVGAREQTRVIGGFGPCGRRTCCSTFLVDLKPISIKLARDQGVHQNPNKVTGLCGKLMCCLRYEVDFYRNILASYPAMDSAVEGDIAGGIPARGTVVYQNPIKGTVTVGLAGGIRKELPVESVRPVALTGEPR